MSTSFSSLDSSSPDATVPYSSHDHFEQCQPVTRISNSPPDPPTYTNAPTDLEFQFSDQFSSAWPDGGSVALWNRSNSDGVSGSAEIDRNQPMPPVRQPPEPSGFACTGTSETRESNFEKRMERCRVCDAEAVWKNAPPPSCAACQAFFRRTLQSKKVLLCTGEGNCLITERTRKLCQKCRYLKCLRVGMKRDRTQNDEKLDETGAARVAKRTADQWSGDDAASERGVVKSRTRREVPDDPPEQSLVPFVGGNAAAHCHSISEVDSSRCRRTSAAKADVSPVSGSTYLDFKYLRLEELLSSNAEWHHSSPFSPTSLAVSKEATIKLILHGLCCSVRQFRRLSALRALQLADQRTLLKATAAQLCMVHGVMKYCAEIDKLEIEGIGLFANFPEEIQPGGGEMLKRFQRTFAGRWRKDIVLLLLSAVILFNPNIPDVTNKSAIESQRRIYLQLLKDILIFNYGEKDARQAYAYLVSQADSLPDWVAKHAVDVIFELSPYSLDMVYADVVGL